MVRKETNFVVADNSGAKAVRCIHVYGSTGKDVAYIGDLVKCAVKKVDPSGQVKKGDVVVCLVVRTTKEYRREDGSYIRFDDNAVVLIKSVDDATPIGSRIFGPIARELRSYKEEYAKIISLAQEVV